MREIGIEDLLIAGYREDRRRGAAMAKPFAVAMALGLAAFVTGIVLLGAGKMALGFGVAGAAWVSMVVVILARYFARPTSTADGEPLERCRVRAPGSASEEIVYIDHAKKTFMRRVVARRDACLPPGG